VVVLVILVTLAFFGLTTSTTSMLFSPAPGEKTDTVSRQSASPLGTGAPDGAQAAGTVVAPRTHTQASQVLVPGEPSAWMVVPVLAGLAVLLLLGLHPPGELTNLIGTAVTQLRGAP